jgi:glycolate oxidase
MRATATPSAHLLTNGFPTGELAEKAASEILMYCIEAGGSITGEHGVGADKAARSEDVFRDGSRHDADAALRFDPTNICNPGKVFPTPRLCGEVPGPYRQHPAERAGLAERM